MLAEIAALVLATFFNLNFPLSRQETTCRFVCWTQWQNYSFSVQNYVYCDLNDGRTIIAHARGNWTPPTPGTEIGLEVETLVFGTNYRIR